ncbi:APH(3'') family aminoglycoside O-phosphotransferase [Streptomonospora sp. S1-112]|uniref:APH(3'') family aminoglycoside O-phosphotransferase n=1 Tax=Streptomonospora mangrovi TaxID=2883123 RepID=A0A9X3NP18_9ACTN|nr:APH(3'') family aminoglycoside O-phosphotransferase [Streptomonospora mangrovi]MDA0565698.1 APH(3'') family aminoglycoside O-phosphotransferase [Streptomonospora mangrovi]
MTQPFTDLCGLPRGTTWEPVTDGESGAPVFRSADGTRYAKCAAGPVTADLAAERDRVDWLSGQGVPAPRVLDWIATGTGACLVTGAVAGVPADRVPAAALRAAWEPIADAVRDLHALPVDACPFTRDLAAMFATARDVVARDAVNPDFLPVDQRDTPPADLLARLAPQVERRLVQEAADAVVCHGDLCLPNIVLDPDSLRVTGFIDLGRLGRADPHADLALLFATARETWEAPDGRGDERGGAGDEGAGQGRGARWIAEAEEAFAARCGRALDRDRERFYLHLDPLTWG